MSACNAGDLGSIPGSERSPGERNGNPLQYPCLENPMDRRAWQAVESMGSQRVGHDWATELNWTELRGTELTSWFHIYSRPIQVYGVFNTDSGPKSLKTTEDPSICQLLLFSHSFMSKSFVTPWTIAWQIPLSMGFSRQEYWGRLPSPSPRDLPDPGLELVSPALVEGFYHWANREAPSLQWMVSITIFLSVFFPFIGSKRQFEFCSC